MCLGGCPSTPPPNDTQATCYGCCCIKASYVKFAPSVLRTQPTGGKLPKLFKRASNTRSRNARKNLEGERNNCCVSLASLRGKAFNYAAAYSRAKPASGQASLLARSDVGSIFFASKQARKPKKMRFPL